MTLAAPWALAGLLVLPWLVWLHRRRRARPPVRIPSLLFLEDEADEAPVLRRLLDRELVLTLLAALCLVLAASLPALVRRPAGRTVLALVSGGAPAAARGQAARYDALLARVRGALSDTDRLVLARVPATDAASAPRPDDDALLAAALGTPAALRLVVSDRAAPAETAGVRWIAAGATDAHNAGLVSVAVEPRGGGVEVFALVFVGDGEAPALRVADDEGRALAGPLALVPGPLGYASLALPLDAAPDVLRVALVARDGGAWRDDLAADDAVELRRRPVRVRLDASLPPAHAALVRSTLEAALGAGGLVTTDAADLVVTATDDAGAGASWRLRLFPLAPGETGATAPDGTDGRAPEALARDLSTAGADLVFAADALLPRPGATALLWRAGRARQVVVEREGRTVLFLPDPLAGARPPARATLWPLLFENVLGEAGGRGAGRGAGYRALGLLDASSTRLGRAATDFEAGWLEGLAPDRPAEAIDLAPPLVLAGVLALALLWLAVLGAAGRTSRRRDARAAVPSPP